MAFFIFRKFEADGTRHQPRNLWIYAGLASWKVWITVFLCDLRLKANISASRSPAKTRFAQAA
jgi:hypothetical protein